jgi:hypothetical protein
MEAAGERVSGILGMPLDAEPDDHICTAQPLCGMVVVKALGEDGKIYYLTGATEGLKSVECLGMAEYAVLRLKRGLEREIDDEGEG